MREKISKNIVSFLFVVLGNALVALGVCFFVLPMDMIMGGVTGIGLVFEHYTDFDIAIVTYIVNIFFFFLGLFVMGKKFAFGIIVSTITFPTFLYMFKAIPNFQYTGNDLMLATIFAALFIGFGGGLILKNGASSGGIEVLSVVVNAKTGIPLALLINCVDCVILAVQLLYSSVEQILYGLLLTFLLAIILDKVLVLGEKKTQVIVISPEYTKIRDEITGKLDLGCTMLEITTGYHNTEQQAVMCVLNNRKLTELYKTIHSVDEKAFIVTSEVNNVKGRGFSLPRMWK